jgi:type I restriction enzyme S subunit
MTTLRTYPEYRPSGIEWLSELPSHWQQVRGKALFRKLERDIDSDAGTVTCFRNGEVTLRRNRRTEGFTEALQEIGYQGVRRGDLVIHAMDAFAGAVGVSDSDGKCSPVYSVCAPREDDSPYYFARIVREMAFNGYIQAQAKGIRERSTDYRFEAFGRSLLPRPPLDEQRAIADFLDAMDERITRFIDARRRMIALMEEQKQAIINHAVARGLDADVPVKPSGVDWLGDIPAHWRTSRLKFETSHIVDCLHATPTYSETGTYPAVRTADIVPGQLLLDQTRKVERDIYELWTERLRPLANDILYSREGERYGIAAPVPEGLDLCISQRMMIFRCQKTVSPAYIMWQLNSHHIRAQASSDVVGATAPHVNVETIQNYLLAIPPFDEQNRIAEYIDRESHHIDLITDRHRREIELIREFRTRLISDVVTGKLDVRRADAGHLADLGSIGRLEGLEAPIVTLAAEEV